MWLDFLEIPDPGLEKLLRFLSGINNFCGYRSEMYIWRVIKHKSSNQFYLCKSRLQNILGIKGETLRACHNICKLCRKMIPFTSFQLTAEETSLRNYTLYALLIKEADTSLEHSYTLAM